MMARRVAVLPWLLMAILMAGCGSAGTTLTPEPATPAASTAAASPTSAPSPAPASRQATAAPTEPPSVTCVLPLADGSRAPTMPLPATLPASLPIELLPTGAAIYALTYPQQWEWKPDALYMAGPAGGTCAGYIGTGLGMQVLDARGDVVVDYVEPLTVGPSQQLSCPYIAAARKVVEADWGDSLDPSACVPDPGDRIIEITTGVRDLHLAVVLSSAQPWLGSEMSGSTASLYSFRKEAEDDAGASWRVTCATSAVPMPTCYAALAFFAGGTPEVNAQIAAALGVPAIPGP